MTKSRLDLLLAERGLFESRSRAAAAIMAGQVRLGTGGARADKPGQMVTADVEVDVERGDEYVSRGGVKLANALQTFDFPVSGRHALDAGASTGGFTDVLLQRGAAHVVAVDVGYGELHWRLREDPRVTVLERVNARALSPEDLPYAPDLVVADLSFISLRKVLPAVLACAAPGFDCLALVKPQFELERERVGKGGVVRASADRHVALTSVAGWAVDAGYAVRGFASSELPGPAGNRETFIWIAADGGVEDIERAVAKVEP
jgi:23S rRNA (cytidine1920-2'-O)/16S rRNA (cytidine1409-2'-O)-methyltransferase